MDFEFDTITIVGLGLLGGSAAMAAKACDPKIHITGIDKNAQAVRQGVDTGAVDRGYTKISQLSQVSGLVILATEVGAFETCLKQLKDKLSPGAVICDLGSTKGHVVKLARKILGPRFKNFVPSHPMAGSEQHGISYARGDLFTGATCIVTPVKGTAASVVKKVTNFWQALSMRVVSMSPQKHDRSAARISHLPHLIAGLVMLMADNDDIDISSSGFRDITRLASGNPQMWRDIVVTNRKSILDSIDKMQRDLMSLKDLVDEGSGEKIQRFLTRAKKRRDNTIARIAVDHRITGE